MSPLDNLDSVRLPLSTSVGVARGTVTSETTIGVGVGSEILRLGLRRMLSDRSEVAIVWEGASIGETLMLLSTRAPHILLLDGAIAVQLTLGGHAEVFEHAEGTILLGATHAHDGLPGRVVSLSSAAGRQELFEAVDTILGAGNASSPNGSSEEAPTPSAWERSLLGLVASGSTNRQIASALDVTEDIVKAQLRSLFAKWDVRSRSEAAVKAIRLGVID